MGKKERLSRTDRRQMILDAAIRIVVDHGWESVTRESVSKEADVAVGTVNMAYGTMDALRDEIMKFAIDCHTEESMLKVIAKGLVEGNKVALNADNEIKKKAFSIFTL